MNVNPFSYLIEKLKSKADKTEISTAGTGLQKNGTAIGTYVPRTGNSANTKPGQYSFKVEEYVSFAPDVPTSDYYHIITSEGMDDKYVTQLALGMTTNKAFVRRCENDTWGSWHELAFNIKQSGWHLGFYVEIGNGAYGIFCPYDVSVKGTPSVSMLDINFVSSYTQNITIYANRPNGIILQSDDLPNNASYVGRVCSVYFD